MRSTMVGFYVVSILAIIQFGSSFCLVQGNIKSANNEVITTVEPEPVQDDDFVPIDKFPEPFSNDKLPGAETDTNWCDTRGMIGCFKQLPAMPDPIRAEDMKAAFSVSSGKQEVVIEYKVTKHCLRNDTSHCWFYPFNLTALEESSFNPELRTIIAVPGFKSGQFDPFLVDIRNSWNSLENVNVIMVAWTGGNGFGMSIEYPGAAANVRVVARQISALLYYFGIMKSEYQLTDDNYVNQVFMVGHSLGAHISGFVGKDLAGALGSVAGLDPAKPNFMNTVARFRLDRSDALLVQTIHTNTKNWGIPEAIGNLDFYANDGVSQPGCGGIFNVGCSHSRSHEYYVSLLQHEKRIRQLLANSSIEEENHKLYAHQSKDYRKFVDGTSRRKLCPKSVLDDKTFDRSDIKNCITPMDFVSDSEVAIENLKSYGIDVEADSKAGKSRKFYFHTQEDKSYLNNHFVMKIYFAKDRAPGSQCKISVDVVQPNGKVKNYQVGYYALYENQGYLEANIPILASDLESKYSLAEVDANDYYTNKVLLLQKKAKSIFPNALRINGQLLNHNQSDSNRVGLFDWCDLQIESIHLEPLNKLNRYFSASFSERSKGKKYPDIIFSEEYSASDRKKEQIQLGATSNAYLDSVTVGPTRIPDLTLHQTGFDTVRKYGVIVPIGMIFVGLLIMSLIAIVVDRKWLRNSVNATDTQPIVCNN